MPKKRNPVICPKCKTRLLAGVGTVIEKCGCDVYCPACSKWFHLKGTDEKGVVKCGKKKI